MPTTRKEVITNLETLNSAKPYIKGILAFIIYLIKGELFIGDIDVRINGSYSYADKFIRRLEEDICQQQKKK